METSNLTVVAVKVIFADGTSLDMDHPERVSENWLQFASDSNADWIGNHRVFTAGGGTVTIVTMRES
jgi:sigma54-dependent transcription regulator